MARGNSSKEIIFNKILEIFNGSFMADSKTLRIPLMEDGTPIEIKVTLTAAKDILGGGNAVPVAVSSSDSGFPDPVNQPVTEKKLVEPTAEELANVEALYKTLGF